MSNLVGKFCLIAYNSSPHFMLDKIHRIKSDNGDTVTLESGTMYRKEALLKISDDPKELGEIMSMNHKYLKVCAENREREKRMRIALETFITDFS